MKTQTVTPARLNEMMDDMPVHEVCEALGCTEDELVELLKMVEEG